MRVHRHPAKAQWEELLQRPVMNYAAIADQIRPVIEAVRVDGDEALRKYSLQFDGVELRHLSVGTEELNAALNAISTDLLDAIRLAAGNITAFHKTQLAREAVVETMPGVTCWRQSIAIERVGLYIPGGTAPLFSTVLMLAVPAILAGCKEVVLCTPPNAKGEVHPAVLAAAAYLGLNEVYKVGGVQAIAAMAFGTSTVPRVSKIFGPGNQYVTAAKQLVQQEGVAIDMPAGPSEVAVFADASANADFIAADLLSQAEHGADSQVLLVTDHEPLIAEVEKALTVQLARLPRQELATKALDSSNIVLVGNSREAMEMLNAYAPEHLILASDDAVRLADDVVNAGSVFIGHYSPESVGDYASGTNHTLPTNGFAHAYSGVSVDSFVKKVTFQMLSSEGLQGIGPSVTVMAEAEGLRAHAEAVRIRLK